MKWISAKEKKPNIGELCLAYSPERGIGHFVGYIEDDGIWKCYIPTEGRSVDIEWVTDWMFLPENNYDPFQNQPERSKREDSVLDKEKDDEMGKYYASNILITEMRCSELYGNIERDK